MFPPHNVTPTSPPYSGNVETKEQRKAKKAAQNSGLWWTACYDDECLEHLSAKQGQGWFPKKPVKKEKEPAWDIEWETTYNAEPGSDWGPPPPAKMEKRPHKDLVKWQHCFRDNCRVHRREKVDAGYYSGIVGSEGVLSRRD